MYEIINSPFLTKIYPLIAAALTWFFKDKILVALRIKKEETGIEAIQLENVQKALTIWQEMLDDTVSRHRVQVDQLEEIIKVIKSDLDRLQNINSDLESMVREQKDLIVKQSKTIKYYKEKYEKNKEST